MPMSSNADDPRSSFTDALKSFGLDSPSRGGKTVGDRALKTIAERIHERGERFEGPDGRWADNAESTIKKKGRNAPNHDHNDMMSLGQIEGEQAVSHNEATMAYGKDDECRAKAGFAHSGQSKSRILRPFYAITEADADAVFEGVVDDLLNNLMHG
jgi:hypothetical protein